ncbi:potassium channel family protein [Halomicroarcula sp. GCM10025817]|uniref:potassium channel family protein n=1 Tax=Haloarcula TaxID=2237 RepID=UPI0023E85CC1|nr:TrkA family potassium uptake protein [Halomicroarcula sp. SYNS111]
MRFVIVGAGRVGLRTARVLKESGHEVVLVEVNETTIERARDAGFEVIAGDAGMEDTIEQAYLDGADALGALTGDLNTNFVACMVAKEHGCRTVMRIDEDYREEIYRRYASEVDEVIYPERLGAIAAKNALLGGNIRAVADIAQNLQLVEFTIAEGSPMEGYSLSELELPADSQLMAHAKGDLPLGLPNADETLEAGDKVVVLADFNNLADVRSIVVGDSETATALGGA